MSENSLSRDLMLSVIKTLISIYDLITFPIYAFIQKPWNLLNRNRRIKAKKTDPNDPYSPWIRCEDNSEDEKHFIHECQTVCQLFRRVCLTFDQKKCFGVRDVLSAEDEKQTDGKVFRKLVLSDYHWFSYRQINQRVDSIARGLSSLGVKEGDAVVIFAETRVEWMISAQAVFRLGATVATLYSTLGSEAVIHGMNETRVSLVITAYDLLPKLGPIVHRMPLIQTIVFMDGLEEPKIKKLFPKSNISFHSFSKLESIGRQSTTRLPEVAPKENSTAVLMYTSGSTGVPKAVQITHKNLLHTIKAFFTISHALSERDVYCAYLPLAHVLELAAELFFFSLGLSVGFATPLTLTDKSTAIKTGVKGDTTLLRPTVMCAVPLILDRIRKSIEEEVQHKSPLMRQLFYFCIEYKKFWTQKGFRTPIIDFVICRKIRALLGGRIRLVATGSAPLAPETHEFIRTCLNVELLQGYGLTETTASVSLMDINDLSVGRVGAPLRGVQIKLVDWLEGNYRVTDKPHPRGEIVVGGDNITNGYFQNPELTAESYREENGIKWFFTGDIGEMTTDGTLKIIDRKKDLVKLQFGEYISLGKIESELKSCPLVDNICVYGDSFHCYLIALIVPNSKSLDFLAKSLNKKTDFKSLCKDPQIIESVSQQIAKFGQKCGLHKNEIPCKVHLVCEEWLPDSGLVTAALKLRRKNIQDFYEKEIKRLYSNETSKST